MLQHSTVILQRTHSPVSQHEQDPWHHCHRSVSTLSQRGNGRAGRSELSLQMDPQLRGAAKPRLGALFLPCRSTLMACMQCVGSFIGKLSLLRKTLRQSLNIRRYQSRCTRVGGIEHVNTGQARRFSPGATCTERLLGSVTPKLEMDTLRRRHTQVFEATMMERRCEVESTSAGSRSTSAPLLSTADP